LDKANYILPLVLNNSSDDINIDKRQIFIVPNMYLPNFKSSGILILTVAILVLFPETNETFSAKEFRYYYTYKYADGK